MAFMVKSREDIYAQHHLDHLDFLPYSSGPPTQGMAPPIVECVFSYPLLKIPLPTHTTRPT